MQNDPVNHPSHYTDGKFETIDYIEGYRYGFHLGNAVKYISRAGKKDGANDVEDLKKALWYLNRFKSYINKESIDIIDIDDYSSDKRLSPALVDALHYIEASDMSTDQYFIDRAIKSVAYEIKCRLHLCKEKEALE